MIYIQNCISLNALLVNMDENHHFPLISRVKIFFNFKLGIIDMIDMASCVHYQIIDIKFL